MEKFQRNYRLEVEGGDKNRTLYIFEYPMTLEFNIQRAALASANTGSLKLYNLSQNTRKAIYKDIYSNIAVDPNGETTFRHVRLLAGYGDNLTEILNGNIKEAKSFRESGSTNFITEIDCYDWSFAMVNAKSDFTLGPPETTLPLKRSTVINRLLGDMVAKGSPPQAKLSLGFVSNFDTFGTSPYTRPYSISGNTWDALRTETGDHCFIDNGVVHCMKDDDAFDGDIKVLDSTSGLLSTPKKAQYMLKVDVLFEPTFKIGQYVDLNSTSESLYNGRYKIIGIQHSGIISGAVSGKCTTSLILHIGEFELNIIKGGASYPLNLGV